jgi:hypothetical protein
MAGPIDSIKRAIVGSLEACFTIFGERDDATRSCPISLDKYSSTPCSHIRTQLGWTIDSHSLTISLPEKKRLALREALVPLHPSRKQTPLQESLELLGSFEFAARYTPWLRHLFAHIRAAVNAQISRLSKAVLSSQDYIDMLAHVSSIQDKDLRTHQLHFYQRQFAREAYHSSAKISWSADMLRDVDLLRAATHHPACWSTPIAHIIPRINDYTAFGDSCLHGAGGYSVKLQFWWHLRWDRKVQSHHENDFACFIHNADASHINILEFATIVINFIIAQTILVQQQSFSCHPHPTILLLSDNTSAISWCRKAANSTSHKAKSIARLLAAHIIHSPLGLHTDHVRGEDNGIADRISRFTDDSPITSQFSSLTQDYPELRGCRHFPLPQELVSLLSTILSSKSEPPELHKKILERIQAGSNIF